MRAVGRCDIIADVPHPLIIMLSGTSWIGRGGLGGMGTHHTFKSWGRDIIADVPTHFVIMGFIDWQEGLGWKRKHGDTSPNLG